jgi:SpoVK/Ycf46/Vps4 family AAA+-type ATPase
LATSNYPEKLGDRIMNRPSRFDKRFKMGHPKRSSRKLYFDNLIDEDTRKEYKIDVEKWVDDTEEMSIAHMKELFIAVCILGNSYEESLDMLRNMIEEKPNSSEDDVGKIGFGK